MTMELDLLWKSDICIKRFIIDENFQRNNTTNFFDLLKKIEKIPKKHRYSCYCKEVGYEFLLLSGKKLADAGDIKIEMLVQFLAV